VRRLPLPWRIADYDHCLTVIAADGTNVCNIPLRTRDLVSTGQDTVLSRDEAFVVARQIVKWAEEAATRRP
jgi:hypothetical protein